MEKERKFELTSMFVYIIFGIVIGYASFLVQDPTASLGMALIFLFLLKTILIKTLKLEKDSKWFMANGGIIYIFVWFISWIIFYNVM